MKQNLIQIRSNQVHAPSEIIKNIAIPDDENKFEIDMSGSSVGWLGDKGNIVLKGSCFVLESCVNGAVDNSLIILNSSDDYLAYINESGDMCISSGDCLDNHADCSNPTDSLAIKNSSDDVISYLNGSVCLTGKLYESIENLDSGETNDSLIYDSNGNLISDGDYDYTYNEFNQLSSVSDGNGVIAEYYYNAEGSRIKKLENNETTYYIGDSFVQVRNDSGVFNEIYYYDNDKLIASNISGEISYYHPDHLGSTTLITNESGDVIEETFYLPFGEIISGGDARYDYTGKELDNVGLMYYGARYYSSEMMKFTQADLVISEIYNPQDLNHYSYVRNNPYKYVDPNGREVYLATRSIINPYSGNNAAFKAITNFAVSRFTHSYFNVAPDNPEDFGGETNFQLGAYPSNGILNPSSILEYERGGEGNTGGTKEYSNILLNTPEGKTDTEFINEIIGEGEKLNEANVPYLIIPIPGGSRANSNVFVRTAIENTGTNFPSGDISPNAISPGISQTYDYKIKEDKSVNSGIFKKLLNLFKG